MLQTPLLVFAGSPSGTGHLKPLGSHKGRWWRWLALDWPDCSSRCCHELLAVPLPWPLLFSACWTHFNSDSHLYLVFQYNPAKFEFLFWAAWCMFMVVSPKTLINRCLLLRLTNYVWDHRLCFGYGFFLSLNSRQIFCPFQSTAELPEG